MTQINADNCDRFLGESAIARQLMLLYNGGFLLTSNNILKVFPRSSGV
ncbi:hypothetical protein [Tychonema sp. LEGE 07203]|nr:hypothetical protein [Tychonema sp. LEGE 07203]MBE9096342.1 hypothetical protein [Tychonema sp. LEGE 07203]